VLTEGARALLLVSVRVYLNACACVCGCVCAREFVCVYTYPRSHGFIPIDKQIWMSRMHQSYAAPPPRINVFKIIES